MRKLKGSPIKRIGYDRWLRNLAVGLGNARRQLTAQNMETSALDSVLKQRLSDSSDLVREHILWALAQTE